jgi:hypothetical protein
MLPFSSGWQATRVVQDFNITEDVWNARRTAIRAEHRLANASIELDKSWKELLVAAAADGAPVAGPVIADGVIQFDE